MKNIISDESPFSSNLPTYMYDKLQEISKEEGISVSNFIVIATAEKLSSLATVEYLRKRSERSTQKAFEDALSEIPDAEPEDYDKL